MTRHPITADTDASGLFHGPIAVAYTLHTARQAAYAGALDTLDRHINARTRDRLTHAHHRIDRHELPAMREYDLISGLTGTGVYLLHRSHDKLLREVLAYLVRLAAPITTAEGARPGWWTPHGPSDQPDAGWPGGHGNLGMAHGIAGPLALLSIAARHGITVPGQLDAIGQISTWLDPWRSGTDEAHTWWPGMISLTEYRDRAVHQLGPQRPSWCYGTPGLARAQQLAGLALDDEQRRQLAENALLGCLHDPRQLDLLTDASICHGWAGLALTTWRMAADPGSNADLAAELPRLRRVLDEQQLERNGPHACDGLLEGQAGVRLVTHTISRSTADPWDACLLLAG